MCNLNLPFYEQQIETGWQFVMDKLYDKKTNMIYDYLTEECLNKPFSNLPSPEEIKNSIPNPCGWGTGMEDSTLNLCIMVDAALARYALTKENAIKEQLLMLCDGLIRNGTAAEPGFIARSICHADGKSVYIDSSRDQYTNWIYAAHLLINSEIVDEQQKAKLKEITVNVAKKLKRDINSEHKGFLCRLDGYPGKVSQMIGENLDPHELLRTPMIYMAAFEACKDKNWLKEYYAIIEPLLLKTEETYTSEWIARLCNGYGKIYGVYQAQYSFKLLYDLEQDKSFKERYKKLMLVSANSSVLFTKRAYDNIELIKKTDTYFKAWRNMPLNDMGMFYGKSYFVPDLWNGKPMYKWLRNMGEAIIIQSITPTFNIQKDEKEKFYNFIEKADFANARNYWPVLFCAAWWLAKANGQIS